MTLNNSDDKTKSETFHLDDILAKFKLYGPSNLKNIVLLFIILITNCVYSINYVFIAEQVGYRCKDERFSNNTCGSLYNSTLRCTEWEYDDPNSFMAELACQEWKVTTVGTVHSIGFMIGLWFVGPLADKIGRKKIMAVLGMMGGILGSARSFTTSYWAYLVMEFLEAGIGDVGSTVFLYAIEIIDHKRRLIFQLLVLPGFAAGYASLALAAWLTPYWRHLLRVIYVPAIFLISYLFLADESARWLLSTGKKDEAVKILEKMAKADKVQLNKEMLDGISNEKCEAVSLKNLLKMTIESKALLKRLLICITWWITSTFVNYGMEINAVSLDGNKYISFGLLSVPELLATILMTFLLKKFRRKLPLACNFFIAAIFCVCQPFIPKSLPWISILIYMTGKLASCMYFSMTYLFTAELFPTYTRNSMHGLCSSIGRIGSIIAPQTPLLMAYWTGAPAMIFGLASLLAGLVTLLAPDTADEALPDNVQQAEELGTKAPKVI